jgi:hypothetical protein
MVQEITIVRRITTIAITVSCILLAGLVFGQTVHKDELRCFAGCVRLYDSDGKNLSLIEKFDSCYVSEPCWSESEGARLQKHPFSSFSIWVVDTSGGEFQDGLFCWSGSATGRIEPLIYLRWYILVDYMGGDYQRNVLSVWRKEGDSLSFQCGQRGPFDSKDGLAIVRRVTPFPDSSLLLVVYKTLSDRDEWQFMRGQSPCDFEPFYTVDTEKERRDGKAFTRIAFKVVPLVQPRYLVERVTASCSYRDFIGSDGRSENMLQIGQTSIDTIDVWRLAVEHFGIDTTSFPRK